MRKEFPLVAVPDYSLCNEFCRNPRYKPLLTEAERKEEMAKQDKETRTLEGHLPPRYRGLIPINSLDFFGDAYLTSSDEVLKISGYGIAEKTQIISTHLEKRKLPALRVKEMLEGLEHYKWAFVSDFHGPSLDWFVFDSYPEYTGDLSLNLRRWGEIIATFENANVELFDSHSSNYSSNGENVIRIDLESIRWPTIPLELLDLNDMPWSDNKITRSSLKARIKGHSAILSTVCSLIDDLEKSEIIHYPEKYEFIAKNYLLEWGVHCKDEDYKNQQRKLITEIYQKSAEDVIRGYNSRIRKPCKISPEALKYERSEAKLPLEVVLKNLGFNTKK